MAENKTKATEQSVSEFVNAVPKAARREEAQVILDMIREITGEEPKMWGPSIIGFGKRRYKYESGREGETGVAGFSPRAQALTIYIQYGFEHYPDLMAKLGKYTIGKSCLYIKKLSDVDLPTLRELITQDVANVRAEAKS
jgi:Domain of unknown function (DU1801)